MNNPLVVSILTALCFGGWPLISRATGANATAVSGVVSAATAVLPIAFLVRQHVQGVGETSQLSAWLVLIIAGAVNGVGMVLYGDLVSSPNWDLSTWVPLAVVLMVLVTVVGGLVFYGETLSIRKVIGIACAITAVWLMR